MMSALALAASACGGDATTENPPAKAAAASSAPPEQTLAGVCPATVVAQTDWNPEAEHGALYELVGPGYQIDADKKRVSGPLMIGGKDTGVRIEVRTGGPAIAYQTVTSQMYLDPSITLGMVSTDGAIGNSDKQPVVGVVAPLRKNPQILMWDPKAHPDWNTIADIGKSDARVLYVQGSPYGDYLVEKGLLKKSQLDGSYKGTPATFVAEVDKIAQQGFATAEPYIYEHEVRAYARPVKYQLIADTGYDLYPQALSVRASALKELSPCLKKLVPIIQQAQVDYISSPDRTNKLIVELVEKYNNGWAYSEGVAAFAAKEMRTLAIVGNEDGNTLGNFSSERVQKSFDTIAPLLKKSGKNPKVGLKPTELYTNQFIDSTIGLK
ncbi:hypothetical protein [Actinopolymorpha alba]|uniref:hypothetical protein n=1 Tax=Actinopolymorpha alba TaxID=533267 RepID=UPI00036AF519|nr:hypothetical protein [Actinopolymorpha alba]